MGPIGMVGEDTRRHLTLEGSRVVDIPSFYDEINRVFMAGEDWKLGESLDALNDLLHGGYGAAAGASGLVIVWRDIEQSKAGLGADTTLELLRSRVGERSHYNGAPIAGQIEALETGKGKTYFDIVMEVIATHPTVEIVPA